MLGNTLPNLSPCDRCGCAMTLVSRVPKVGPHPELQTFRCTGCGHVETQEAAEPA